MSITLQTDGILQTFPRAFCFPKSRINKNGGNCKPWRMHRPSNLFALSCKKPFKPCLYNNYCCEISYLHVWLTAFRRWHFIDIILFVKRDFCKKKNSLPFDCKLWSTISKEITVVFTLQFSRGMSRKMNRKFNLRKLALLSVKQKLNVCIFVAALSRIKLNFSFSLAIFCSS